MSVHVDPASLSSFKQGIKDIIKNIDAQEMNMIRAKAYKDFAADMGKAGRLDLKSIGSLTSYMTGDHNPMSLTGKLLSLMKVVPASGNSAEVGYFPGGPIVPSNSYNKITYTQLAIIHHTGYRIPLKGEKGKKVRDWFFAVYGVKFKGSAEWLIVPPRPFMDKALDLYKEQGIDNLVVEKYLKKKGFE
jgi:hypothetical protein